MPKKVTLSEKKFFLQYFRPDIDISGIESIIVNGLIINKLIIFARKEKKMTNNNKNKDEIIKLFLRAARSHHQLFERRVSAFGVHRSQHKILMYLSHHERDCVTQKDIADSFEISAAAVAVSLRKLEADDMIRRVTDKSDNRANNIILTERGQEVVRETKSLIHGIDDAMFEGFDDEETELFSHYLSRLCDNIKQYDDTTKG